MNYEPKLFFIKEHYFVQHSNFQKMLDLKNYQKQSKRTHLCMLIDTNVNKFYIPLRNNLGDEIRKYGRIGHAVPSNKRHAAGLDYRYALIINDDAYIEFETINKLPHSQLERIRSDYEQIKHEFSVYLNGFIKNARKGRIDKEPLYRESSLINYLEELGISRD